MTQVRAGCIGGPHIRGEHWSCDYCMEERERRYGELREAARTLVGMYMADLDIGDCVARLEDLTGGQQNGS